MEKLYDIKDKLCEELEEYARKQDLGAGDLEVLHKLTDTIKNIDKICMLEEEGGYSGDGEKYDGGASYANRGKHWVRGHYSSAGGRGGNNMRRNSRGRYGRTGGYSRDDGRSEMLEHLEMAIESANDQDRETIQRFMRQLENA